MRTLVLCLALSLSVAMTASAAPAKPAAKAQVGASGWHPVVPFIEDDFGRALALAKARKLPIFIEGWAPW
jgi:hypothetical protein